MSQEQPFFIVGAERSGTTLLRIMLAHHPSIACQSEFEFAVDKVGDDGTLPDAGKYLDYLATDRVFLHNHFEVDDSLPYNELVRSFLEQKRQREGGKPILGATVHRNFDRLLHLWPEARFIHILRDGRDVARSNVAMGWYGNVWCGAELWLEAERLWEKMRAALAEERWTEVKSEQLIAEPVETLTRLCGFLGVEYDPAMLEYPQDSTYGKPDPKLTYQWKRKLNEKQVRLLEGRLGGMLAERGYELSGLPPLEPGPLMRAGLRIGNRAGKMRFRIARYGPGLWLRDALARRLGTDAQRKRVQQAINAVDEQHLK